PLIPVKDGECCDRATSLVLSAVHSCIIGKSRKPCCGQGMKVALVVRHSQQQKVCLSAVPIGKQAQTCNVVVCHLSVGLCEYATARGVRAIALPSQLPDAG